MNFYQLCNFLKLEGKHFSMSQNCCAEQTLEVEGTTSKVLSSPTCPFHPSALGQNLPPRPSGPSSSPPVCPRSCKEIFLRPISDMCLSAAQTSPMAPPCPKLVMDLPSRKNLLYSCKENSWRISGPCCSIQAKATLTWAPAMTIWPFLPNVRPLMAAFLPAFTFYPISTSPKSWSDTFGNSKHRFQSISRGASITSSASLGFHLVLHMVNSTRIQAPWLPPKHARLIPACFCPGLYASYPLARSTRHWGATHTQCGDFIFVVSLPSLTSFPLSPRLAQVGLRWDWTLSWERADRVYVFTKWRDGWLFLPPKISWESLE